MGLRAIGLSRRARRRGFSLAEVVVALGVAATGLAGALAAASVAAGASRDAAAMTRAIQIARTCLASPADLASDEPRVLFADEDAAGLRAAPFAAAVYRIVIEPCAGAGRNRPVCLTISWPPHQWNRLRVMTARAIDPGETWQ